LEIQLPVILRAAAGGGRAIHHPVKRPRQPGQRFRPRQIGCQRDDASRPKIRRRVPAQPENFMSLPHQFGAQRQAHITAAHDQDAHTLFIP
jgi:hypothetical protein